MSLIIFTLQHASLYGVKSLQTVMSTRTDVRITSTNVNVSSCLRVTDQVQQ
jgi:hypothetical protein